MKRLFDIVTSAFIGVIFFPLFIVLLVLVRMFLGSPVFFVQDRAGKNGKLFKIFKFRTMSNATDEGGELLPDERRLTRFGKFLRSTSLDELPQLINVIKGEMSLVGPRPLLMDYLPYYNQRQATRHDVRPGVTGWAQINGRNTLSWEERFELDAWYVENWSMSLDLKILVLTVLKVFGRKDINGKDNVMLPKFTGSPRTK